MKKQGIAVEWIANFSSEVVPSIIDLVNCATVDGGTLGYAKPMSDDEAKRFIGDLQHRVSGGEAHVLVGSTKGEAVFLAILSLNLMPNCRHRAELSKGVIRPDFRGRHLVELAFSQIVLRAEQLGIEQLVLDVREDSRAHMLLRRFGFVTYGVLEDYARANTEICRGHFMVQTVESLRKRIGSEIT